MKTKLLLCMLVMGIYSQAFAGSILVSADTNISGNSTFFSNVFSGTNVVSLNTGTSSWNTGNFIGTVDDYTASFSSTSFLDSSTLSSTDWLIAGTNTLYTASTMDLILDFMDSGGNIFIVGEGPAYTQEVAAANQLLDYLGSSIDVLLTEFTGTASALVSNSWTSGASTFSHAYVGNLSGGTALYGLDGTNYSVAFEEYSTSAVPLPAAVWLFGPALFGMLGLSRRRESNKA